MVLSDRRRRAARFDPGTTGREVEAAAAGGSIDREL